MTEVEPLPRSTATGTDPAYGRTTSWATAGALAAGVVLAVCVAQPSALVPGLTDRARTVLFVGGAWVVFAVGAWLVRRLPARVAVPLIVLGGLGLPLIAGLTPPRTSDDLYRYVWDGRVQAAGIDPYRYPPAAPELVGLRDDFLWPRHSDWCVAVDTVDLAPGCSLINRPAVRTIYPPAAEALFAAVHLLSPDAGYAAIRLAAVGFAVATTVVLLAGLRRLGADPRTAVLWAWCPTVVLEAGNNAHIDVAAAGLTGVSLIVLARGRTARASAAGGVLLGLAVATKLTPALVAPAVLRRRPVPVASAVVATVAAVYVPHLVAVGGAVIGFTPGYLAEEGYADGSRSTPLSWVLPDAWTTPAAIAILSVVALLVARTSDPDRPWLGAAAVTGTALLVAAPTYPWYAMLLVVLVALGARVEWMAVAVAGYLAPYGYGAAIVVVAGGWWVRRRCRRRLDDQQPRPRPLRLTHPQHW